MEKLKPCPLCGGKAEIYQVGQTNAVIISCMKCHLQKRQKVIRYSIDWLKIKMTETWNTRTVENEMADALADSASVMDYTLEKYNHIFTQSECSDLETMILKNCKITEGKQDER